VSVKERRKREKRQREETILQAAEEIIRQDGFVNLSMDKIAEKAELSKGTLYLYFENKQQLLIGIIKGHMDELIERLERVFKKRGELRQLLRELVVILLDFYKNSEELFHFLHQLMTGNPSQFAQYTGLHQQGLEYREKFMQMYTEFFARFDPKMFRCSPTQMTIILNGILTNFFVSRFFDPKNIEIEPDLICDIFLRGVLK